MSFGEFPAKASLPFAAQDLRHVGEHGFDAVGGFVENRGIGHRNQRLEFGSPLGSFGWQKTMEIAMIGRKPAPNKSADARAWPIDHRDLDSFGNAAFRQAVSGIGNYGVSRIGNIGDFLAAFQQGDT